MRYEVVRVGGRAFELLLPADADALLDAPAVRARFDQDEYMPYWATLWPGARLLAEIVTTWPVVAGEVSGPRVLELGCGVGLVGLVAASRGYHVTLSDYDEDALAFAVENALRNGVAIEGVRQIDWRCVYPDIRPERILAADVLYEARHLEPVAAFVARHLASGGQALIADANRATADPFEARARAAGLTVTVQAVESEAAPGTVPIRGRIFHLTGGASTFSWAEP